MLIGAMLAGLWVFAPPAAMAAGPTTPSPQAAPTTNSAPAPTPDGVPSSGSSHSTGSEPTSTTPPQQPSSATETPPATTTPPATVSPPAATTPPVEPVTTASGSDHSVPATGSHPSTAGPTATAPSAPSGANVSPSHVAPTPRQVARTHRRASRTHRRAKTRRGARTSAHRSKTLQAPARAAAITADVGNPPHLSLTTPASTSGDGLPLLIGAVGLIILVIGGSVLLRRLWRMHEEWYGGPLA